MADTRDQKQDDQNKNTPLLKNRYRLGRILGRGGMCVVYQAWDTRLERNVAVKWLEPPLNEDARTRARFDREGRALAQLSHPNLVTLIDRGSTDKEDYLVFEYVEGRSLKESTRNGPLPAAEAGHIAGQAAEGLAVAHLAGIIHRDVKPQNILIDRHNHAKVTDFGIATGTDWTRVTRAGSIIGSARYMSPEQVRSKPVDARSDIYSLGIVMYEMLVGHPPFDGNSMPEIARQHLSTPPVPLSEARKTRTDLPPGLEKVVMRCLEKRPEDRFSSMDELLGALVGLGLYTLQRVPEAREHRRLHRRTGEEATRFRRIPAGVPPTSVARRADGAARSAPSRMQARALARKKRTIQRWRMVGATALLIVIIVVVLLLALGDDKAPDVVGLHFDEAQKLAEQKDMKVEMAYQVPSFDQPTGLVLEQDPPAGEGADDILRLTVARKPQPVKVTKMEDYDPEGDEQENPELIARLTDGDESTGWTTEPYRSSTFGSIDKTGVGLRFTLAEKATVIEITSTVEGWKGELLQDVSSDASARLAVLAGHTSQILTLREGITSGRIWLTQMAELSNGRWGVELTEIRFYR